MGKPSEAYRRAYCAELRERWSVSGFTMVRLAEELTRRLHPEREGSDPSAAGEVVSLETVKGHLDKKNATYPQDPRFRAAYETIFGKSPDGSDFLSAVERRPDFGGKRPSYIAVSTTCLRPPAEMVRELYSRMQGSYSGFFSLDMLRKKKDPLHRIGYVITGCSEQESLIRGTYIKRHEDEEVSGIFNLYSNRDCASMLLVNFLESRDNPFPDTAILHCIEGIGKRLIFHGMILFQRSGGLSDIAAAKFLMLPDGEKSATLPYRVSKDMLDPLVWDMITDYLYDRNAPPALQSEPNVGGESLKSRFSLVRKCL